MTNLVKLELTKTILKASHSSVDSRTSCWSEQGAFQRTKDWSQFISLAFDCLRAEPHLFDQLKQTGQKQVGAEPHLFDQN